MPQKIILYNLDLSPPVRTVKTVAKLIDVELELRDVDVLAGDHLKEDYLKLNPEHTVPTLVDNGNAIWDSHTICAYLIDKYAKDDQLYPKDVLLRAKLNQPLFFDAGSLFVRLRDCSVAIFFKKAKEVDQGKIELIYAAYDLLEAFLETDPYLVGNNYTLADISVANTVFAAEVYAPVTADKYPKIFAWLDRCNKNIPHFEEINGKQLKLLHAFVRSTLEKNKSE